MSLPAPFSGGIISFLGTKCQKLAGRIISGPFALSSGLGKAALVAGIRKPEDEQGPEVERPVPADGKPEVSRTAHRSRGLSARGVSPAAQAWTKVQLTRRHSHLE